MVISMFEKGAIYSNDNIVSCCVVVGILSFVIYFAFGFLNYQVAKSAYLSEYNQIFGYVKDILSSVF